MDIAEAFFRQPITLAIIPSTLHADNTQKKMYIRDRYLAACAATFHNGIIDLHQILMTKGINNELPMVRWY